MKRTSKGESFVVRTRRQKSCSREIFEDLPQASREEASLSVQEQPLGVGVGLLHEHDVVVREHAELLARELARTLWIYCWRERQDKCACVCESDCFRVIESARGRRVEGAFRTWEDDIGGVRDTIAAAHLGDSRAKTPP